MVELIGDVCTPSSLVLPTATGTEPNIPGQLMMSGTSIIWYDGSSVQTLSGSNTGN